MERLVRLRLRWGRLYEETRDAGHVCHRCGIPRPTLHKWYRRYTALGADGLRDQSTRPHHSPNSKITLKRESQIRDIEKTGILGARRIQSKLRRLYSASLSLASVYKVLCRNGIEPLRRIRRQNGFKSYKRPIPDDRGREFFAIKVRKKLVEYGIKFRPNTPRSSHLNGKVERSERTDVQEFYSTVSRDDPNLAAKLDEWQFYYNWHRPHRGKYCFGKTPMHTFLDSRPLAKEKMLDQTLQTTADVA